jgi:hypothetical protein
MTTIGELKSKSPFLDESYSKVLEESADKMTIGQKPFASYLNTIIWNKNAPVKP